MFGPVGRQIRVQQKKLDPADIHVPDLCVRFSVRQFDGHFHVWNELNRPGVEVIVFKCFLLPAGGIEVLPEIPLLVEKPDAHERKAQIAGGFQMIAGQHAQSAGKNGKALGNSELGGKIGDNHVVFLAVISPVPGAFSRNVGIQFIDDPLHMRQKGIVLRRGFEDGLLNASQDQDWDCGCTPPKGPGQACGTDRFPHGPSSTASCRQGAPAVARATEVTAGR